VCYCNAQQAGLRVSCDAWLIKVNGIDMGYILHSKTHASVLPVTMLMKSEPALFGRLNSVLTDESTILNKNLH
jgi:hypothetical protein